MLKHLYGFKIGYHKRSCPALVFAVRLYIIADKNDISALKKLAARAFEDLVKTEWKTEAFAQAIQEAYDGTTHSHRELRDPIVAAALENARPLYNEELGKHFRATASTIPDFVNELCARLLNKTTSIPSTLDNSMCTYKCAGCESSFAMSTNLGYSMDYACPYCYVRIPGRTWESRIV